VNDVSDHIGVPDDTVPIAEPVDSEFNECNLTPYDRIYLTKHDKGEHDLICQHELNASTLNSKKNKVYSRSMQESTNCVCC
jgi:hypothetical protein